MKPLVLLIPHEVGRRASQDSGTNHPGFQKWSGGRTEVNRVQPKTHLAMVHLIKLLFLLAICFVTSCGQAAPESKKLIDDINAAKVKARSLTFEAERKRREAGDNKAEHDRLIEEAAKLYGQTSDTLAEAASKAKELAKVKNPSWYEEYFNLQAKLFNNLAQLATGAREELLIRNNGPPSESQLQTWKDNLTRFQKENDEVRKQIASIESRQGVVLIKE